MVHVFLSTRFFLIGSEMENAPRRTRTTLTTAPVLDVDHNLAFAVGDRVDVYTEHNDDAVGPDIDIQDRVEQEASSNLGAGDPFYTSLGDELLRLPPHLSPPVQSCWHLGVIDKVEHHLD
jgi:hypothetical protein